jgi:S-DNA-T family DNA segregation ATPase FtsK/SpoIIIE
MGLFRKQITWRTPEGRYYNISNEALKAEHTLIAGTTGCGKTTFVRSIMQAALIQHSPAEAQFILIDPKRFELIQYKDLPHTIGYANDAEQALEALKQASRIMEQRARELERSRRTKYEGADLYVVIDELNDLMISRLAGPIRQVMEHIITLGRAMRVHIIACTQAPNRHNIPASIVSCYTCRFGLKTMHSIESRQIVGVSGCELLPKHGETIAAIDGQLGRHKLPYVSEADINPLLRYWTSKECVVR